MAKRKVATKKRTRCTHCHRCEHLQLLLAAALRTYGRGGRSMYLGPEAIEGGYFAIRVSHPVTDSTVIELVERDEVRAT
jgi:hypothetical protein